MVTDSQLEHVLRTFRADQDENGKFIVRGGIISFLGMGQEFVIDETAQYLVAGKWVGLLGAISQTSYHLPIEVI